MYGDEGEGVGMATYGDEVGKRAYVVVKRGVVEKCDDGEKDGAVGIPTISTFFSILFDSAGTFISAYLLDLSFS